MCFDHAVFLIPGSFFSEPVALLVGAVLAACYVTVLYFMNGVLMGVRVHDFGVEFNKRKGKSRVSKSQGSAEYDSEYFST